jgi:hypothetical protein
LKRVDGAARLSSGVTSVQATGRLSASG